LSLTSDSFCRKAFDKQRPLPGRKNRPESTWHQEAGSSVVASPTQCSLQGEAF